MSKSFAKLLKTSFEGDSENKEAILSSVSVGNAAKNTEDELNAMLGEQDLTSGAMDEISSASGSLEHLADLIQSSVSDGKLPDVVLPFVRLGFENIASNLCVSTDELGLSFESYSTTDASLNYQISLETIGEFFEKLWASIKNTIVRITHLVVDFFKKLFGGVAGLSKHAEALKVRAIAIKAKDRSKFIDIPIHNASRIIRNGKVNRSGILTGTKLIAGISKFLLGEYPSMVAEWYDIAAKSVTITSADHSTYTSRATATVDYSKLDRELLDKYKLAFKLTGGVYGQLKAEIFAGAHLYPADNNWIHFSFSRDKKADGKFGLPYPIEFRKEGKISDTFKESDVIDRINAAEIVEILDDVIQACKAMESKRSSIETIEKASKRFVESVGKQLDNKASGFFNGDRAHNRNLKNMLYTTGKNFYKVITDFCSFSFSSLRAVIVDCERGIKLFEEGNTASTT